MALIYESLVVADIDALRALNGNTSSKPRRADGVMVAVADIGDGFPGWYRYKASATNSQSLPKIVRPTDTIGAWFLFSGGSSGEGGGSSSSSFTFTGAGQLVCNGSCPTGGKAFAFNVSKFGVLKVEISINFDGSIAYYYDNVIEVHAWTKEPNNQMEGRHHIADLPDSGGEVFISVDSAYKWITVFARNGNNGDVHDAVCFTVQNDTITLQGFGF